MSSSTTTGKITLAKRSRFVLAQTWQDFELLIWDDGSTDESVAIARKFAQQDKRVRIVSRSA